VEKGENDLKANSFDANFANRHKFSGKEINHR
jgi:hypothetical protein